MQVIYQAHHYQLITGQLYKRGTDDVLRRCPLEHECLDIVKEICARIARGHFASDIIARKVMQEGY